MFSGRFLSRSTFSFVRTLRDVGRGVLESEATLLSGVYGGLAAVVSVVTSHPTVRAGHTAVPLVEAAPQRRHRQHRHGAGVGLREHALAEGLGHLLLESQQLCVRVQGAVRGVDGGQSGSVGLVLGLGLGEVVCEGEQMRQAQQRPSSCCAELVEEERRGADRTTSALTATQATAEPSLALCALSTATGGRTVTVGHAGGQGGAGAGGRPGGVRGHHRRHRLEQSFSFTAHHSGGVRQV